MRNQARAAVRSTRTRQRACGKSVGCCARLVSSSSGCGPGPGQPQGVMAKVADDYAIRNCIGIRYPAAAAALSAWRPDRWRSFRLDLLHAIVDRLPVIGDWHCHLRPPMRGQLTASGQTAKGPPRRTAGFRRGGLFVGGLWGNAGGFAGGGCPQRARKGRVMRPPAHAAHRMGRSAGVDSRPLARRHRRLRPLPAADAVTFNVTRGIAVTRQERAQSRFDRRGGGCAEPVVALQRQKVPRSTGGYAIERAG
jgi:hypothetical protein